MGLYCRIKSTCPLFLERPTDGNVSYGSYLKKKEKVELETKLPGHNRRLRPPDRIPWNT